MSKSVLEFAAFIWIADRAVPFIKEHHSRWKDRSADELYDYLAWFWGKDLLAISFLGGEIYGVCAIKLFDRLEDFLEPWPFNPTGKFCMVDLLVAVSPVATAECFEIFFKRWGRQEVMLWERNERTENTTGAPRMFTWKQYLKLTSRLTYGLVSKEEKDYGLLAQDT
jgi:hypothetical protein